MILNVAGWNLSPAKPVQHVVFITWKETSNCWLDILTTSFDIGLEIGLDISFNIWVIMKSLCFG